jgi:hypothetical protein
MKNLKLSLTILFKLDTHFWNPNPEQALPGFFSFFLFFGDIKKLGDLSRKASKISEIYTKKA